MEIPSDTPQSVKTRLEAGEDAVLVDVRTPAEHRAVHATGATNIPLDTLDKKTCASLCGDHEGRKVYLICKSGQRAKMASERLAAAGMGEIVLVEGGTDGWVSAGLPVERGAATMDLERQVRIAAGSLVAIGVLLSLFVHSYFVYLSLFVGCGLVFAGVTNTCAMGMLISKMPWNRR